jgi:hypothetical protein
MDEVPCYVQGTSHGCHTKEQDTRQVYSYKLASLRTWLSRESSSALYGIAIVVAK